MLLAPQQPQTLDSQQAGSPPLAHRCTNPHPAPAATIMPSVASSSQPVAYHQHHRRRTNKAEIAEQFIQRLRVQRPDVDLSPELLASIRQHFATLPTRYALDVNVDSLDVLSHQRLLNEARADPSAVSFAVRPVEIVVPRPQQPGDAGPASPQQQVRVGASLSPTFGRERKFPAPPAWHLTAPGTRCSDLACHSRFACAQGGARPTKRPPAFGSSPNLQARPLPS